VRDIIVYFNGSWVTLKSGLSRKRAKKAMMYWKKHLSAPLNDVQAPKK